MAAGICGPRNKLLCRSNIVFIWLRSVSDAYSPVASRHFCFDSTFWESNKAIPCSHVLPSYLLLTSHEAFFLCHLATSSQSCFICHLGNTHSSNHGVQDGEVRFMSKDLVCMSHSIILEIPARLTNSWKLVLL